MSASSLTAAVAALLLAAPALRAQDVGTPVTFGSKAGGHFSVRTGPPARLLYDSGSSDPIPGAWDTALLSGVLPDPAVRFFGARPDGAPVWVEFKVKRFAGGRFWAKARLPRAAGGLRLRALDAGVAADHEVSLYSVEVFADSPAGPELPPVPPRGPMDPSAPPPLVHGRADWAAAAPKDPYEPDPLPWRITLHHTNGRFPISLPESLAETRFIQDFHQNGRGWSDIGYHYLVDPLGNILEGRPLETLGAHALSNNRGNVGIALLGTYQAPKDDAPTPAQLEAVALLGRYLVRRFGVAPARLQGHRDYRPTDCPGERAYPTLDELRRALARPAVAAPAAPSWDSQPP